MRKNQSSLTALGIAIMLAVESEKPENERICYDPYARRFAAGWLFELTRLIIQTGYAEWRGPGVNGYIVARERYIDDVLAGFVEQGLRQLVILGAGFDSRAYRVKGLQGRVKIFELDHPATQEDKLARLKTVFGAVPDHVTYVPIDFNTQSLSDRLAPAGYDPTLLTLWIWQGVTMYLTPAAVDATLAAVAYNAAPGSAIVFDYIEREILESPNANHEVRNMRRYRFLSNESLTFGLSRGSAAGLLTPHGFHDITDFTSSDLKNRYFTGKNAHRKVAGGYGIVVARI